jgi:chorismate dehydratase
MSSEAHDHRGEVAAAQRVLRIGSVSYLNAKPLIYGLDHAPDLEVALDVPSRLLDGLERRRFDVALLPVIDYQRLPGLVLVPSGGIGCDGPTLTVRIFSRVPVERISRLACDTDSHTSVALARVVLAEKYGIRPDFVDVTFAAHPSQAKRAECDAQLMIGDKVVCEEPKGFEHQLDLGGAWKEMTGLPFVFAAWMAREYVDLGDLPARLERAKRDGIARAKELVERYAVPRGWPVREALEYLTHYLKFDVGERQVEAMQLFHRLAGKHQVVATPARRIRVYRGLNPATLHHP